MYQLIKVFAWLAFPVYCRKIKIINRQLLQYRGGPVLLAVNHPNSFLDAIILCTLFDAPLHSLARGDVFKRKAIRRILAALHMLPVYRESEGIENIDENYKTFDGCKKIFKTKGIVLIFTEGLCINEWHLRPLKKGTARLAISCWEDGIPLQILPIGINYSSFHKFGKNIHLQLGEFITAKSIENSNSHGQSIQAVNQKIKEQLQQFVFEIDATDHASIQRVFFVPQSLLKKIILFIPSIIGWLLHAPIYYPVKKAVLKKSVETDHFDSILISVFFLVYPLYLLLITSLAWLLTHHWLSLGILLILPFTAWAHVQLKKQL